MQLKKAKREQVKIRLSIASPTGYGKTTSALMIAYGMTNDWDKICVIDTENRSAALYANHTFKTGFTVGEFNTIELPAPYTPEKYIEAIKACEKAGIEVIIIDSVTHVWTGQGGLIEIKDSLGGTFASWAKVTPRYQQWLNAILQSSCHVITTNRKKQAYNVITENNKTKVEKAGMDDQIRDGYDYEMTIAFDIINDKFMAKAAKDRSGMFMDQPEFIITPDVGKQILDWCTMGITPIPEVFKTVAEKVADAKAELDKADATTLGKIWKTLSQEMQDNLDVQEYGAKIKANLGIK